MFARGSLWAACFPHGSRQLGHFFRLLAGELPAGLSVIGSVVGSLSRSYLSEISSRRVKWNHGS